MMSEHPESSGEASPASTTWCIRLEDAPAAVTLPLLSILAGSCGEPISCSLRDHPPDVTGAIQRFLLGHIPAGRFCELYCRPDLKRLAKGAGPLRAGRG